VMRSSFASLAENRHSCVAPVKPPTRKIPLPIGSNGSGEPSTRSAPSLTVSRTIASSALHHQVPASVDSSASSTLTAGVSAVIRSPRYTPATLRVSAPGTIVALLHNATAACPRRAGRPSQAVCSGSSCTTAPHLARSSARAVSQKSAARRLRSADCGIASRRATSGELPRACQRCDAPSGRSSPCGRSRAAPADTSGCRRPATACHPAPAA
jgi:hypothetical protein